MTLALSRGGPAPLEDMRTIADGVAVRSASMLTFEHVQAFVDDIVTVEEQEISQAVLATLERAKWLVEPAGAVGLAAVINGKIVAEGRVLVVLSGGNIDPLLLTKIIEYGLTAAGRYLMLRVVLPDRPGALAKITASVAALGLNVLSVEHHRSGSPAGFDEVEVFLTLETRGPEHCEAVIHDLRALGIHVALLPPERS
jgi:threonine dehydratase